jgi:hypothetical protein
MSNFGTVMPAPYQTVFDSNGDPVSGGLVWSYVAGTSTPLPTYTDVTLTVPNPNPIVTDSAGRFTAWLPPATSYKFVFEGPATPPAHGAVIRTIDNVTPVPSLSGYVDLPATAGEALAALTVVYLSDGSGGKVAGHWYLADFANAYSSTLPLVGIVVNPMAAGAAGYVRVVGSVTGPVVVVGTTYYVGHVGALQATAPAFNVRRVAVADTPNSLVLTGGGPSLDMPIVQTTATSGGIGIAIALIPGCTLLRCVNTSRLSIHALSGGVDGQQVTIESIGTAPVDLLDSQGPTPWLRLPVTSAPVTLAPGVGRAVFIYDAGSTLWRLTQHGQGAPISPPFNAAAFVGSGGTWTVEAGDVGACQYSLDAMRGLLTIILQINTTTVGAGMTYLTITNAMWGSFSAPTAYFAPLLLVEATYAIANGQAQGTNLFILRTVGTWTTTANSTGIVGQITFPVT